LINHPFKNKSTLEKEENPDKNSKFDQDFNEFTELMERSLQSIVSLLDYNLKTDIN